MKKYLTKYLPVEGKIKERYKVSLSNFRNMLSLKAKNKNITEYEFK